MRYLATIFLLICPLMSLASEQTANWKTFQSDYGYEFKYPECWRMSTFETDEVGDLKKMQNLSIQYKQSCAVSGQSLDREAGYSFEFRGFKSKNERKNETHDLKKDSDFNLKVKNWILFKKNVIDKDTVSYTYVEYWNKLKPYVRWKTYLMCPQSTILASGPMIFNPSKELLSAIENGELSIPDPEKTIYDSIKCMKPKILSSKK